MRFGRGGRNSGSERCCCHPLRSGIWEAIQFAGDEDDFIHVGSRVTEVCVGHPSGDVWRTLGVSLELRKVTGRTLAQMGRDDLLY